MTNNEFDDLINLVLKVSERDGDIGHEAGMKAVQDLKEMRAVYLANSPRTASVFPRRVVTVGELIEQLREVNANKPVMVEGYEDGWDEIVEIRMASVVHHDDAPDYYGEYEIAQPDQIGQTVVLLVGRRGSLRV